MKTNHKNAFAAAICGVTLLVSSIVHADSTSPSVPVGTLTASPTVVQTGTKPTLTWSINYPSVVKDYITVTGTATITAKQALVCDIRILGAGVTTQDSKGNIVYIETAGLVKYNGSSSWTKIFDGKQTDSIVQQQGILPLFTGKSIAMNQAMNFEGYYIYNGSNGSTFSSLSGTNVRALVNGDACPSYIPAYNAPSLETFLKPYLDSSNKVRIGPMDVIIFMELTTTNTGDVGYDFQDLVWLVTFRTP